MKYILLLGMIYIIYKFNTWKSQLSSATQKQNSKINKNEEKEGEYVDYEEVE